MRSVTLGNQAKIEHNLKLQPTSFCFRGDYRTKKLRQDKYGNLYKVKKYLYDKLSKIEREAKRLQELPKIEVSKILNHIFWQLVKCS